MHKHHKTLLPQAQVTLPDPPPMWHQSQNQSQVLDLVEGSPSPGLWVPWHLSITTSLPCRSCLRFLPDSYCLRMCLLHFPKDPCKILTTKPTPDTVHSPTPGQLHVESIQLACTCALCCCYALCMKREELSIFYSLWLRCFVDMLQYVGFLGSKPTFWKASQSWRANLALGARQLLSWRAPSPVLARANCPILPLLLHPSCIPFPF